MNAKLGKDMSMDLLDPCAMRMYPCSNVPYGEEMEQGFRNAEEEDLTDRASTLTQKV